MTLAATGTASVSPPRPVQTVTLAIRARSQGGASAAGRRTVEFPPRFPAPPSWSALDVGQGLRHPPGPDPQHVNTADMPVRPAVEPPDDDPVARAEHLLHLKMRGWRTGEEGLARLKYRLPPNVAGPPAGPAGGPRNPGRACPSPPGAHGPAADTPPQP